MGKLLVILMLCPVLGRAQMETTQVLPKGVASPQVSFGVASGLGERFNGAGQLTSVTDRFQFELNGKNLGRVNAEARRLINALNQFSNNNLGDMYYGGRLDFQARPDIQFMIPTFAYGVTDDFSFGFGVPVVRFRNEVVPAIVGESNHQMIESLVHGTSVQVDDGLKRLQYAVAALPQTIDQALISRGYKPLRTVEFTAVGDFTLAGVYRFYKSPTWNFALKPLLQLPTGRRDDPDDVVDTAIGGQTAMGLKSVHGYVYSNKWSFFNSVGLLYNLPDSVEMRVPKDSDDALPGPESKEMVSRKTGDLLTVEWGASYKASKPLTLSSFYGYELKGRDVYDGDRGRDYASLGRDTQGSAHRVYLTADFSTLEYFLQKRFDVPLNFGYVYGNTLGGDNTRNQQSHHMYLRMFF